ncbi:MAG: hypothetical protein AAB727_00455, partial [Patescibacteria group bacterium]
MYISVKSLREKLQKACFAALCGISLLFVPILLYAQDGVAQNALTIAVSPAYPRTNDAVTLSLSSFASDLNTADIAWFINGTRVRSGKGAVKLETETGNPGTRLAVRVTVRTADGQLFEQEASVRPADVDVYWSAQTYTPPFYKGRALPTPGSSVKITAMPQFFSSPTNALDSASLVYAWGKDRQALGQFSGRGKQSIVIESPNPGEAVTVAVTVTSGAEWGAYREIALASVEPEIIFYERRPSEGIRYEHGLRGSTTLEEKEITVRAEPYFFSTEDMIGNNLTFNWFMNDAPLEKQRGERELTFTQEEGSEGIA